MKTIKKIVTLTLVTIWLLTHNAITNTNLFITNRFTEPIRIVPICIHTSICGKATIINSQETKNIESPAPITAITITNTVPKTAGEVRRLLNNMQRKFGNVDRSLFTHNGFEYIDDRLVIVDLMGQKLVSYRISGETPFADQKDPSAKYQIPVPSTEGQSIHLTVQNK